MPARLQLSFSNAAPKGNVTTICFIGQSGEIISHLEKDVAAHLIGAMATAQFSGKFGKSLLIYNEKNSYLLVGTGDRLTAGLEAEKLGGKVFLALNQTASKSGWLPDHKLDEMILLQFGGAS